MKEEALKKIVGLLISVLGGNHSDSRDLAIAQLVQLCPESIQYLNSYLADELNISKDIAELRKVAAEHITSPQWRLPRDGQVSREELEDERRRFSREQKEYRSQEWKRAIEAIELVEQIERRYGIDLMLGREEEHFCHRVRELVWPDWRRARMTMGILDVIAITREPSSLPILRALSYDESQGDAVPAKSLNEKIREILKQEWA